MLKEFFVNGFFPCRSGSLHNSLPAEYIFSFDFNDFLLYLLFFPVIPCLVVADQRSKSNMLKREIQKGSCKKRYFSLICGKGHVINWPKPNLYEFWPTICTM